jgi:hypothetical protein
MLKDCKNIEKTKKLCSGFSLLDEKDQEQMFAVLQALLFAALKKETVKNASLQGKNECLG